VRERACGAGAQEAVLVAPSGCVLEAATASVLWWEDDTLCLPPPRLPVLPGVTVALVQERARREGIPVAHRERTVAGLESREVWLVNALHGIRPVTEWTGGPSRTASTKRAPAKTVPAKTVPTKRAPEWRTWLDDVMEALPEK
jgi:branched-subunit amino acid aminotransferase/4-amino-4-deoxychorismate lyase